MDQKPPDGYSVTEAAPGQYHWDADGSEDCLWSRAEATAACEAHKARVIASLPAWTGGHPPDEGLVLVDAERLREMQAPSAAQDALDAIAKLCGCPSWDYPGQVVRDVKALHERAKESDRELARMRAMAAMGDEIHTIGADTQIPLLRVLDALTEGVGLLLDGLGWDGFYSVDGSGDHNDSYFRVAMWVGLAYLRGEPITDATLTTPAHPAAASVYMNGRNARRRRAGVCRTMSGETGGADCYEMDMDGDWPAYDLARLDQALGEGWAQRLRFCAAPTPEAP